MTIRYQCAKVWNTILNSNIMYKGSIAIFNKDFMSYMLSTMKGYISHANVFGKICLYHIMVSFATLASPICSL